MSKSSKNLIRKLTAVLLGIMLVAGLSVSAMAADIDRTRTGSLTLSPQNSNTTTTPSGGVFTIYRVAELNASGSSFTYVSPFAGSTVDLNSLKNGTAEALKTAAATLNGMLSSYEKSAFDYVTLDRATGVDTVSLALGVYLVVNESIPRPYTVAASFLVFIPVSNNDNNGWDYDITASPKLGYYNPGGGTTDDGDTGNDLVDDPVDDAEIPLDNPTEAVPDDAVPLDNPTEDVEDGTIPLDTATAENPSEELLEEEIPLAVPESGLTQWPIPVLSICGAGFITGGLSLGRRKKKED